LKTGGSKRKDCIKSKADLEVRMQNCLDRLGLPLKVLWMPKDDSVRHGEIKSNYILIYDRDEAEAWLTFEHEVYEDKFKEVTFPYRSIVNNLIEAVEKIAYERKEKFIEALPKVSEVISKEKAKKVITAIV
jgi:hypothetical protein